MKKTLLSLLTGLSLMGSTNVDADSIARGQRGSPYDENGLPMHWQADIRLGVGEKENAAGINTKSIVNNNVLKYWNGGSKGVWGFASVPYKALDNGKTESSGLGDVTFGGGPRGAFTNSMGSFHFLPYLAVTLPSGNSTARPALGNDRVDLKLGTGFTYLTLEKKGEIGGALEYTRTGIGSGLHSSDEVYGGVLMGGGLSALGKTPRLSRLRLLSGVTGTGKMSGISDGDYMFTSRTALRYTPPNTKRWHAEVWMDKDIVSKGMAKGTAVTGMVRYNF